MIIGRTYKLVDKEGWFNYDSVNEERYNSGYFVGDTIKLTACTFWYNNEGGISLKGSSDTFLCRSESKFFEEVGNEKTTEIKTDKKEGVKYDDDKLDWSLLPIEPTEKIVEVLMFGAKKYAPDNWKYVDNSQTRYYNAAMRHPNCLEKKVNF